MYEELEDPQVFLSEPGQYIAAHGLMLGTTENFEEGDDSINCISLIFIDTEDELHPVILHPRGNLLEYLISDEFRESIGNLRQKLLDKDAR